MPILRNASPVGLVVLLACSSGQRPEQVESRTGRLGAAPVIGSETRIDEPVYTEQSGEQAQPFIVPGGPGALVVWRDDSSPGFNRSQRPVTFARLDADGNMIDPIPTTITPPAAAYSIFPYSPRAAWNGDRALVFWADHGWDLQGSRLTKEGEVLDPGTLEHPGGIDIALGEIRRDTVAVVPFASDFLVFWQEAGQPRMGRVGYDGTVAAVGGTPIAFPADGVARTLVGAVAVSGGVLVMVTESSQTKVMKVDATGAALSALSEAAGPASTLQSAIASGGSGALVCWTQGTTTGKPVTIYGRHVGADGAWTDAAFEVRAAGAAVGQVGAVWNGSGYLCTWTDDSTRVRASMREIPASGAPVAAAVGPIALATLPIHSVQVAWTGSRYLAAMERTVSASVGGSGVMDRADGVLVRALGTDLKPIGSDAVVVTTEPNEQPLFRAVGCADAAYVVWEDDRLRGNVNAIDYPNLDVFGSRVTVSNGGLVKTPALLLTGTDIDSSPGVGWDGTQFTVAYVSQAAGNGDSRYLQHVSALGALAGSRIGPLKATGGSSPVVIWNGQNFLVAALGGSSVILYRASAAGVQLDTSPLSVSANVRITNLQGVALGSTAVLVFQTMPSNSTGSLNGQDDLMGLAVNADGTLLTPKPVTIANGVGAQEMPAIASDGTSVFLLWRDRGVTGSGIAGTRLDATLARLDGADAVIAQATAPDTLGPPALAWTGNQYVAVWTAGTGGALSFVACSLGGGGRCSPGSETTVATDLPSATPDSGVVGKGETDNIRAPALVWTDAGGVLSYRRLDTAKHVNRERVFVRPIGAGSPPPDGGVVDASVAVPDGRPGLGGADGGGTGGAGGQPTGGTGGRASGGTGGRTTGGAGGGTTSGIGGVPTGVADAGATGGSHTAGTTAGQTTGGDGGPVTSGDAGAATGDVGLTGASDGAAGAAAVDAGKPRAASQSGCSCTMGEKDRSSLPWPYLLLALMLLRRCRRRSGDRAADGR